LSDNESKKTMLGIPGIDALNPKEGEEGEDKSAGRSTVFGMPVGDILKGPSSLDENTAAAGADYDEDDDDFDDEGATQMISAEEIGEFSTEDNIRSTAPSGLPSLDQTQAANAVRWTGSLDDEDSDVEDATSVAPASLFSSNIDIDDPRDHSGFSQFGAAQVEDDEPRVKHETLMGMSLEEIMERAPSQSQSSSDVKRTVFSMPTPAFGDDDGLSEISEDDDGAPTQALNASALSGLGDAASPQDNRQRLLDKLRSSKKQDAPEPSAGRSTMFGIPSIAAERDQGDNAGAVGMRSAEADEQDPSQDTAAPNTQPSTTIATPGIVKRKRITGDNRELATGVLGGASYKLHRGDVVTEDTGNLRAQEAPKSSKLRLALQRSKQRAEEQVPAAAEARVAEKRPAPKLNFGATDASTQVADGDRISRELFQKPRVGSGTAFGGPVVTTSKDDSVEIDADVDSTRVASIAGVPARSPDESIDDVFGQSSTQVASDSLLQQSLLSTSSSAGQSGSAALDAATSVASSQALAASLTSPQDLATSVASPDAVASLSSGFGKESIDPFADTAMASQHDLDQALSQVDAQTDAPLATPNLDATAHAPAPSEDDLFGGLDDGLLGDPPDPRVASQPGQPPTAAPMPDPFPAQPVAQQPAFGQTTPDQPSQFPGNRPAPQQPAFGQQPASQSGQFGQAPAPEQPAFGQPAGDTSQFPGNRPAPQQPAQPAFGQTPAGQSGQFSTQQPPAHQSAPQPSQPAFGQQPAPQPGPQPGQMRTQQPSASQMTPQPQHAPAPVSAGEDGLVRKAQMGVGIFSALLLCAATGLGFASAAGGGGAMGAVVLFSPAVLGLGVFASSIVPMPSGVRVAAIGMLSFISLAIFGLAVVSGSLGLIPSFLIIAGAMFGLCGAALPLIMRYL